MISSLQGSGGVALSDTTDQRMCAQEEVYWLGKRLAFSTQRATYTLETFALEKRMMAEVL